MFRFNIQNWYFRALLQNVKFNMSEEIKFYPIIFFRPFNEKSSPGNISNWNSINFLMFFVNWWTTFVCQMHPHFKLQVGNINRNFVIYMSIAVNKRNQEIRIWGTSTFTWKNNQFSRHLNVSKLFIIIYPTCLNQLYANTNTKSRCTNQVNGVLK